MQRPRVARRIGTAVATSLDGASKQARDRMAATIEGGRAQAGAAIAQLLSEAQTAAREAARARLWAVCAAGIAGVLATGLILFQAMPLLVRIF